MEMKAELLFILAGNFCGRWAHRSWLLEPDVRPAQWLTRHVEALPTLHRDVAWQVDNSTIVLASMASKFQAPG